MFIKKVYRYSKPLGIGMLFFVLVQLFCFYKGGMVFSPWYNYGMYSERIMIDSFYYVNKIDDVKGSGFSPQVWDKIHYTLQQYQSLSANDSLYENEVQRIFKKVHLPAPDKSKFIAGNSNKSMDDWYFTYIMKIRAASEIYLNITTEQYHWDGKQLLPIQPNAAR